MPASTRSNPRSTARRRAGTLPVRAAVTLRAILVLLCCIPVAAAGDGLKGAFFRPPVNVSHSPSVTSLARTSPRSLVLGMDGPAYLFYVERITHTGGATREITLATHRSAGGWDSLSTPVGSWDGAASVDPTCALDRGQALHLAWIDRQAGRPQVYGQMFQLRQGRFSEPLQLSDGRGPVADPALAVGPEGWIHLAWSEVTGSTSIVRHRVAEPGGLWHEVDTPPTPPGTAAYGPDLAVDGNGIAHLTWELGTRTGVGIGYAAWSRQNGWSAAEMVVEPASGLYAQTPVIADSPDGSVWVVWASLETDGTGGLAARRRRPDGTWEPPLVLASGAPEIVSPAIAIDVWGVVHVLWQEATEPDPQGDQTTLIIYSAITGTPPAPITPRPLTSSESGPNRTPMLAVDRSGRIMAAWIDESVGPGDLLARSGVSGFARPGQRNRP